MNKDVIETEEPIHEMFGLSYARYLVLPRSAMQSMPMRWQKLFRGLVNELRDSMPPKFRLPEGIEYSLQLKDKKGRFVSLKLDPLNDYKRGRRNIFEE